MTIKEQQDEIIEEFSFYDDWTDKYERLIEIGKEVPMIDPQYKTDDYLIRGCQSQVWLHAENKGGKVYFTADSDAIITRGLIGLLVMVFSGQQAEAIAQSEVYFIDKIGLHGHLSPTRRNGLSGMLQQIKQYAQAIQISNQSAS